MQPFLREIYNQEMKSLYTLKPGIYILKVMETDEHLGNILPGTASGQVHPCDPYCLES